MNISFFLKPKVEVSYLYGDTPARHAVNDLVKSGFTAIPVISRSGKYIGTICEGDFLRLLLSDDGIPREMPLSAVPRRLTHNVLEIDARMHDLVDLMADQNFAPVVDGRGMFIGIVTRHDMMAYLQRNADDEENPLPGV